MNTDTRPRIFGLGLNKTGTTSLHQALIELGFTSFHWGGVDAFRAVTRAVAEDIPLLTYLDDHDAYSDIGSLLTRFDVADRQYPGSKFILTTRDMTGWLGSRRRHVERNRRNKQKGKYDGSFLTIDLDAWRGEWRLHHARVRRYFRDRPADLLVMDIAGGSGYEELCPFLGVPQCDTSFPHGNQDPARRRRSARAETG